MQEFINEAANSSSTFHMLRWHMSHDDPSGVGFYALRLNVQSNPFSFRSTLHELCDMVRRRLDNQTLSINITRYKSIEAVTQRTDVRHVLIMADR